MYQRNKINMQIEVNEKWRNETNELLVGLKEWVIYRHIADFTKLVKKEVYF